VPKNKEILALSISIEQNMFVAERFNPVLWKNMGSTLFLLVERYMVSTSICRFLKLQHHIHSPYEKSVIERTAVYQRQN
jgi:putative transposase